MKIDEIEQIIWSIQTDLYNQTDIEYFDIQILSNGFCQKIIFLDIEIWSSEDDMREWDEIEEDWESLNIFLRREIMFILYKLTKIKL